MSEAEVPMRAPVSVVLLVCPRCGRTDRYTNLEPGAGRHYAPGGRGKCPGVPVKVRYATTGVEVPVSGEGGEEG